MHALYVEDVHVMRGMTGRLCLDVQYKRRAGFAWMCRIRDG